MLLTASLALLPVAVQAFPPAGRTHAARPAPRTPPAAAAADDDDDNPNTVLSRCQQRAQRNLQRLDHLGDMAHSATERIGHFLGAS
ncbi:MAG: hypothetical protein JO276_13445, partial [Sphingomonadaceae bacterium]|nr:hypothetical protein [Sphingomonadaceae bacterium]